MIFNLKQPILALKPLREIELTKLHKYFANKRQLNAHGHYRMKPFMGNKIELNSYSGKY